MLEFFGLEVVDEYCIGLLFNLESGVCISEMSENISRDTRRCIPEGSIRYVGCEVLTAEVMKSSVFSDKTPCSPLKIDVSEEHVASIFRADE
jgi:hypothetical protein